jgi:hypothetical protein
MMAVESSFNPFAQSPVGAQGLMQVMTRVHDDKYEAFGGAHAAFDPVSNLRVGVQVLKECIQRAGSLQEGLRYYVGAAGADSDGGYVVRVLAEHAHLRPWPTAGPSLSMRRTRCRMPQRRPRRPAPARSATRGGQGLTAGSGGTQPAAPGTGTSPQRVHSPRLRDWR